MKILIVSSWYPPVLSGSSLWAESLVDALRKRGHEVRVVTTLFKNSLPELDGNRPEIVYRLPAFTLPRSKLLLGLSIAPIAYSLANRRRILEIVQDFRPDVIHQINHIFDTVFLSAYAAEKTNTPLIGSITTPIQSKSPVIQALMHLVDLGIIYNFGVRYWQRIICSDAEQSRYTTESYGKRVNGRVVKNIFVGMHERIRRGPAEERVSWPQLVTVGHVHEMRDPTNIIRAMPAILQWFPDARLDIAGRLQFKRPLKEVKRLGLESSVRFLGEVPAEQVSELVSRAHVFVILHHCRYAGLSFTAIEAMNFETPVVINAPDDIYGPHVIQDGVNIVLVDRNNVNEIAQKIIHLLEDENLRKTIGSNGKKFVEATLNWDINAEKTEELYVEILQRQGKLQKPPGSPSGALKNLL